MKSSRVFIPLLLVLVLPLGACGQSKEEKAREQFKQALSNAGITTAPTATVSKEVARGWPTKFCSLTVGMTRDEIRAVMGEPSETYNDSSANQDQWKGWDLELTAFYNIDDVSISLDDSVGTANLPCGQSRK